MEKRKVYLDNSATTAVASEVIKKMQPYFGDIYGNPSSFHFFGRRAKTAIDKSRAKVACLLNASPEEILFTGSGTESDNIAIFGLLNAYGKKGHIISTRIEHHAVLYSCRHLEELGYEVTYLGVDKDGVISVEDFKKAIKDNTILVSIMHANNEVGAIQPIEVVANELKKINTTRKNKIYFHTDAVQTAGKLRLDVKKLGVDMLAISAHKFNGPKGIGVLYVKKGVKISPIMFGGHHENRIRPGTENTAFIVGCAKALEISNVAIENNEKHILYLREKLKKGILEAIPGVTVNGSGARAVSNILNISFKYIEGEALLLMLDMKGIAVSTGSACASGLSEPSHVLSSMCVDPVAAQGAVRFSFGHYNTEEDVDYALRVLPKIVSNLRSMSPVWNLSLSDRKKGKL
ncbi:MAG: aminotransferase class V-fold PLP-dependent enzyme [Endomicrobium sp.]|jgi:cysteine desulfurase|nr:aminotransferase class V-fold PLP-dependent enzyme [Endomicrobium sp.]